MNKSKSPQRGKRHTAAQRHAWGSFGGGSCVWGKLTEEQYRAWEEAAKQEKRRRRWPASRRLTGQNLLTEINAHQSFLGLPPLLYPADYPGFGLHRVGPLSISDGGGAPALKLTVPQVPAGHTLVFASPPCPAGRRVWRDFRFLGLLPAPVAGESDITEMYS